MTSQRDKLSKELKELLLSIHSTKHIEKGSYLFQEGETAEELYLIQSGKIQMGKITADGRELTLRICSQDDLVGELTLFSHAAKYMLSAKVLEDGTVSVIPKVILEKKLEENPVLALEFMKWMSDHFRKTQTKFRDLVLHGKKGALYSTLIRMTNSFGIEKEDGILLDINLTNQELANFCGTSREVVNRMLSDLKKNNILSMVDGKIFINDLDFIKDEIQCEDCPPELCNID